MNKTYDKKTNIFRVVILILSAFALFLHLTEICIDFNWSASSNIIEMFWCYSKILFFLSTVLELIALIIYIITLKSSKYFIFRISLVSYVLSCIFFFLYRIFQRIFLISLPRSPFTLSIFDIFPFVIIILSIILLIANFSQNKANQTLEKISLILLVILTSAYSILIYISPVPYMLAYILPVVSLALCVLFINKNNEKNVTMQKQYINRTPPDSPPAPLAEKQLQVLYTRLANGQISRAEYERERTNIINKL